MATIPLPALHVQTEQQSPLALYAQAQQILNARQQNQLLGLETQRQQIGLEQTQALNRSYAEAIKPDENGIPQIDTGVLTKSLAASNAGAAIPGAIESVTKYNKSLVDLKTAQTDLQSKSNDLMGHAAAAVKNAGYDPRLAHTLLDTLPGVNPAVRAKIDDPVQLKQLVDSAIAQSPKERELASQEQASQARVLAAKTGAERLAAEMPGGALESPDRAALQDYLAKNPGKGPADFAKWKAALAPQAQINVAAAAGGGLSDVAKDQAAEKYWQTGQLPPAARGVAGLAQNRAIMNRAAELHPEGSLAANSAEFKANSASLSNLQKNFDQIQAFENTAIKNIDQVVNIAKNIPDLGVKFANIPIRKISADMIGTENMSRLRTALATAQAESAKVLTSANASGVLSDSARKDAQDFLDGNLPYGAMVAQANQLKTDFGNRHQSYQQQIADIQGRLGVKQPPPAGGGNKPPTFAEFDKQRKQGTNP